jgi:lysophospholipase L1-like esterase
VTPYGPYFDLSDEELRRMSIHHFLDEAARLHGSELAALGAEVELITRVARQVAARSSAQVIDMLEASRSASLSSADFTEDGVHFSPTGNAVVAKLIARRVVEHVERATGYRD